MFDSQKKKNIRNFSRQNAKKKRENNKKTKKKSYFYRRANIDQTQNVTNETISQNVMTNDRKRDENRNQNDVHRNDRDKKIIRENDRDNREKRSFNKFKMTCYYCNKIEHLKNEYKNFIVD